MNWYKGTISEAVAFSKTKNAIFVVYVEGKDESTAKLNKIINDKRILEKLESEDFVAVKIEGGSEPYMQFASIFQIVPIPSIFFIGKTGTPLDIATGLLNNVEEFEEKIERVLLLAGKKTASRAAALSDFIQEEAKASTSTFTVEASVPEDQQKVDVKEDVAESNDAIACKDGVCFKKSKEVAQESVNVVQLDQINQAKKDEEAKLAETRNYLEQKRRERIEEEKRLEKERELRRRKEGKEMQNLCAWQKDQELKELKETIKREKLEEQAARERIRAQIAADKAERAYKFSADAQVSTPDDSANSSTTMKTPNTATTLSSDESRLQFRLATGNSNTQSFKTSTTLAEIREYVTRELLPGTDIKEFTLATTYPKRELISDYDNKTLTELELFPSAVILIIGKEATGPTTIISRNGGLLNMMFVTIMAVLNPIFSIFHSTKNWLFGTHNGNANMHTGAQKSANENQNLENDASKRRNLDGFSNSGTGNTTGTSSTEQSDSIPSTSQDGAYRRYAGGSNIHRLSDNRKDSDDENATWNGNSTQQQ